MKTIKLGDEVIWKKKITLDDMKQFANLTEDDNPVHFDGEAARESGYPAPLVHGMFVNSLVSTVMGTKLPGNGTVLMDQQVKYCGPVFAEDEVTVSLRFAECEERNQFYIGTFEGICHTQDGREVLRATCRQLMSKKVFVVEQLQRDEN